MQRLVVQSLIRRRPAVFQLQPTRFSSHDTHLERFPPLSDSNARERAGNREYVGYFLTGDHCYSDRPDFPYPSMRFRKEEGDILKVREKEKGDWGKLSLEEKKRLYRHSFANTMAEILAPKGYWKAIVGVLLFFISVSCWIMMFFQHISYGPPLRSFSRAHKEKALQNMIDTFSEPITGIASKYDYENNRWKA